MIFKTYSLGNIVLGHNFSFGYCIISEKGILNSQETLTKRFLERAQSAQHAVSSIEMYERSP